MGEIELPLVPEAWLQSIVRYTNSNKCSEDIRAVSLSWNLLNVNGKLHQLRLLSRQSSLNLILLQFISRKILPNQSRFRNSIVKFSANKTLRGLESVPFLVTTWELLISQFGSYREIERELPLLTGSELMLRLDCLRSTLDIAVTFPSWVHQRKRRTENYQPLTPESLPEAYGLGGSRQVNQIGKDFSFSRTPSDLLKQVLRFV